MRPEQSKCGVVLRGTCALLVLVVYALPASGAAEQIAQLVADMQGGPVVYSTEAAQRYFLNRGEAVDRSIDSDRALLALRSVIGLADLGSRGWSALGPLAQRMPKAVHVESVTDTYVRAAGTFEDWVMTRTMGAKNRFLLKPPFFTYEILSPLADYLEVSNDVVRSPDGSSVTIHMVFTLHAGAYALSRITSVPLGTDEAKWREWWDQHSHLAPPATAQGAVAPAGTGIMGRSAEDLVVGGEYRIFLGTGDAFRGRIESRDASLVIIEDAERGGFSFRPELIDQFELIALPQQDAAGAAQRHGGVAETAILSFEELVRQKPGGGEFAVTLRNGTTLTGRLVQVEHARIMLEIDGSRIPVGGDAIASIVAVAAAQPVEQEPKRPVIEGPLDTVFAVNPETDDWGNPLPHLVLTGRVADRDDQVALTRQDGTVETIPRSRIVRITRAAGAPFDKEVERYARPLFCPDGMVLVDIPPGKEGRPFFKVCIDRYEYPNTPGELPRGNVSFEQARQLCAGQGKRLCTVDEWRYSCSGLEEYAYPYGHVYDKKLCNTKGIGKWDPAGAHPRCVSKFGVYDLSGNIWEWVTGEGGAPMAMGGPYSKCDTPSPGGSGEAKEQIGFRCCTSN